MGSDLRLPCLKYISLPHLSLAPASSLVLLNTTSSCAASSTQCLLSPPVDNSFSVNIVMLSSSIPFILLCCRIINSEGAFHTTLSKIAWIPWFYWLFLHCMTVIWPCVIYFLSVVVFCSHDYVDSIPGAIVSVLFSAACPGLRRGSGIQWVLSGYLLHDLLNKRKNDVNNKIKKKHYYKYNK